MNLDAYRVLRRLALAGVLLTTIGVVHGLDVAMIVGFSLVVMEIDAYASLAEAGPGSCPATETT